MPITSLSVVHYTLFHILTISFFHIFTSFCHVDSIILFLLLRSFLPSGFSPAFLSFSPSSASLPCLSDFLPSFPAFLHSFTHSLIPLSLFPYLFHFFIPYSILFTPFFPTLLPPPSLLSSPSLSLCLSSVCLPTCLPAYLPACLPSLPSFLPSFLPSLLPSFLPSFPPSFIPSFIPSLPPSFIPSFFHSFIPSFIHSSIPSFLSSFVFSFLPSSILFITYFPSSHLLPSVLPSPISPPSISPISFIFLSQSHHLSLPKSLLLLPSTFPIPPSPLYLISSFPNFLQLISHFSQDVVDITAQKCDTSFSVILVSEMFEGKPLLRRHRLVNSCLADELKSIHAFTLKTWTPEQWEKQKEKQGT